MWRIPLKLLKHIFYHTDSFSMYHVQGAMAAAIKDNREADAAERSSHALDPLAEIKSDAATIEEKFRGLHHNLALQHFKDISLCVSIAVWFLMLFIVNTLISYLLFKIYLTQGRGSRGCVVHPS